MIRALSIAMAPIVAALLCSCSGTVVGPSHSPSAAAISQQQRSALRDGIVTWDEYKTGFDAYQACLAKAGYRLATPHVDEYQLMDFGIPDAAVRSGVDKKCYQFHWAQLDGAWQMAHQDSSESAKIIAACLEARGVTPAEKYSDNVNLMQKHNIDVSQCPPGG
ncbi:hypothetical protein ACFOYW_09300 [Gryllotalpicola reticulitermitis]|uniref:Lipoprotein n=1 Tax=Gryllotalpicola reticulitermitis TaxID=1184153 RepID=A0ABV8Q890_9MICO